MEGDNTYEGTMTKMLYGYYTIPETTVAERKNFWRGLTWGVIFSSIFWVTFCAIILWG